MQKPFVLLVGMVLALALALAACGGSADTPTEPTTAFPPEAAATSSADGPTGPTAAPPEVATSVPVGPTAAPPEVAPTSVPVGPTAAPPESPPLQNPRTIPASFPSCLAGSKMSSTRPDTPWTYLAGVTSPRRES